MKIVLIMANYAKNCAGTIYQSLVVKPIVAVATKILTFCSGNQELASKRIAYERNAKDMNECWFSPLDGLIYVLNLNILTFFIFTKQCNKTPNLRS